MTYLVSSASGAPMNEPRYVKDSDAVWRCGTHAFSLDRPLIMGIVNVTPDSFSDGGRYLAPADAIRHAEQLVAEGADLVDVGGESTRPGSAEVTPAVECARVLPVIEELAARGMVVSVDTRHAEVAREALSAGARVINDVSGFRDTRMCQLAAESDAGLVVMHMAGTPQDMQRDPRYDDVVTEVRSYLLRRAADLVAAGVARDRICLDPGPGFGKTCAHNVQLLERFDELCDAGFPVAVATSRKRFVGELYGKEEPAERAWASVATAIWAVERGASMARVHDVAQTRAAFMRLAEPPRRAYVALGSNEGDRIGHLSWAAHHIGGLPATSLVSMSPIYESEPAYYTEQAAFANAVVAIDTRLHPRVLLAELQRLELAAGRRRTFKNAPRPLDLDICDYEGETSTDDELTLPHARLLERDFVVRPFLDIASSHVLADGMPLSSDAVCVGRAFRVLRPSNSWASS
jgi:dihydropteroate synthase